MPSVYPHSESFDAWNALRKKKLKNSFIWGGIGAAAVIAGGFTEGIFVAVPVFIITAWVVTWVHRISSADYYLLPHARNVSGEHRCIFCGNRGIYRQGQYKTNNTHSNCSKCQKHLFTE